MVRLIPGPELKKIRIGRLWSEEDVCDLTGIEIEHLTDIEEDREIPTIEEMYKLSRIYKVSIERFIEDSNNNFSDTKVIGNLSFRNHDELLKAEDFFKSQGYFVEFQVVYATNEFSLKIFEVIEGNDYNGII